MDDREFNGLEDYLSKVPAIVTPIAKGTDEEGLWWIKFSIDIDNPLAWNVVQEIGHVVNYLSLDERLPALFYPVSPPPYMNGGPRHFLSWIIESKLTDFKPATLTEWLEGRLPRPVEDLSLWEMED